MNSLIILLILFLFTAFPQFDGTAIKNRAGPSPWQYFTIINRPCKYSVHEKSAKISLLNLTVGNLIVKLMPEPLKMAGRLQ